MRSDPNVAFGCTDHYRRNARALFFTLATKIRRTTSLLIRFVVSRSRHISHTNHSGRKGTESLGFSVFSSVLRRRSFVACLLLSVLGLCGCGVPLTPPDSLPPVLPLSTSPLCIAEPPQQPPSRKHVRPRRARRGNELHPSHLPPTMPATTIRAPAPAAVPYLVAVLARLRLRQ